MGKKSKSSKKAKKKNDLTSEKQNDSISNTARSRETSEGATTPVFDSPADGNSPSEIDSVISKEDSSVTTKSDVVIGERSPHSIAENVPDVSLASKESDSMDTLNEKEGDRLRETELSKDSTEDKESPNKEGYEAEESLAKTSDRPVSNGAEEEAPTPLFNEVTSTLVGDLESKCDELKPSAKSECVESEMTSNSEIKNSNSTKESNVSRPSDDREGERAMPESNRASSEIELQKAPETDVASPSCESRHTSSLVSDTNSEHIDHNIKKNPTSDADNTLDVTTVVEGEESKKLPDSISICSQTTSLADTCSLNSQIISAVEKTDSETGDEVTSRETTPDSIHKEDSDVSTESTLLGKFTKMGDVVMGAKWRRSRRNKEKYEEKDDEKDNDRGSLSSKSEKDKDTSSVSSSSIGLHFHIGQKVIVYCFIEF